jgi:hypothetical protein
VLLRMAAAQKRCRPEGMPVTEEEAGVSCVEYRNQFGIDSPPQGRMRGSLFSKFDGECQLNNN